MVNGDEVIMRVCEEGRPITTAIPIDRDGTNLPVVRNLFVSEKITRRCSQVQVCFKCDWPL